MIDADERDASAQANGEQHSPGPVTPEAANGLRATSAPQASDVETVDGHERGRRRPNLAMPTRVGRYVILRRLGEGGMGVVLEAFDPELDRKVAIKLLQPSREGSQASQRLIREAQVMARLSHPNVVAVHDAGFAEQRVFLAMELVRGQTLRAWLEATQPTWRAILAVFLDAGRGLAAAHADGIIHRDFKPENVLVSDEADGRRVRVADFGLANYDLQSAAAPPRGAALALTATGAVVGTPVYMAPEQHAGLPLDAAADQFSFCVALHEALFAQRPFAGDSAIEIATNVCEGRYVAPIHSRRAPRWLSNAIRRGLAADPRARYCDFAELLAALARDPIARVRRGVAIAAAGIALALGSWALAARAEPCEGARAEIAAVWNDDARARVQQALVDAPQSAEKTVAALDRYADDWAVQHREMCTAHQAGSISAPLLDGAMHCLDQREAALARLVGAIGVGSASDATLAAIALPAIASCGDRNALARAVALPSDETSAHAVAELRRRLVEVEVVHHAGAIAAAQEELAMIADLARPLAYAPLSAEVELVAGRLAMERFEWALATERFAAAAELGVGAGADAVAAEALARELFLDALAAHAPEQVLPRARVVTGLVHRLGDPPALASLLANNLGVAQAQAGRTADAERSFAEAVALAEQTPAVNASDLAGYRINLARHTADAERRDAIFVQAARELASALGDAHPKLVEVARQRAELADPPERAIALLGPVCELMLTRAADDPLGCHFCAWRMVELHERTGAELDARAAARTAAQCLAPTPNPSEAEYVAARRVATQGLLAVLEQRDDEALAELASARDALAPQRELPWIAEELAVLDVLAARVAIARGHGAQSRRSLLAAVATFERRFARLPDPALRARRDEAARLLTTIDAP